LGGPWFDPRARRTFPARPFSLIGICRVVLIRLWQIGPPVFTAWLAGGPLISVAMIFIGAFLNEKAVCRLSKNIHSKSSRRKDL
jgi:hypothetical protein